jgi:hypothetical protein
MADDDGWVWATDHGRRQVSVNADRVAGMNCIRRLAIGPFRFANFGIKEDVKIAELRDNTQV